MDLMLRPLVFPAARLLKRIRTMGIQRFPGCRAALMEVGVFPIDDHYYEPLFNPKHLTRPLTTERILPGIAWNIPGQLALLGEFAFSEELRDVPLSKQSDHAFFFNNGFFESGDAEFWYNIIRARKPRRIVEIGSGYSTLMARRAIAANTAADPAYRCDHVCVEPTRAPWLDALGVTVVRENVETMERALFDRLGVNDMLFIDSSHVIRPQGDVLFEYLELLPSLKPGVIVHVHDIFSPRDYLEGWIKDEVRLWNEQYLLEAFLTSNRDWQILASLNHLHHHYSAQLAPHCPFLTPAREPGSFYLQRVS